MMDLILQLNAPLKEMENELDNLIQFKQVIIETTAATTIPTVTTIIPSTLAASLAPTTPAATTLPTTSETTSATSSTIAATHPSDEASKLIKDMEDMSIQTNEINRLKEQIKGLEE